MRVTIQYRDEEGNVHKLTEHQPKTLNEVTKDAAVGLSLAAIVAWACIVLIH